MGEPAMPFVLPLQSPQPGNTLSNGEKVLI